LDKSSSIEAKGTEGEIIRGLNYARECHGLLICEDEMTNIAGKDGTGIFMYYNILVLYSTGTIEVIQ
jgi:hypothetical protein